MRKILPLAVLLLCAMPALAGTGRIVILNSDKPGEGLNDVTPAAPVGGNNGTTLGQQRMNVFRAAAERWESQLDIRVNILVSATFAPITQPACTATSAVLGQARPERNISDFKNAPRNNTWYPIALANQLAGEDLLPNINDIFMQFNAQLDSPNCLGETKWYYGLDGKSGNDTDLFVVTLHELAHGLGVSGATSSPNFLNNRPAVSNLHMLDLKAGLTWDQMSQAQRNVSHTNTGNLVWRGENVKSMIGRYLLPAAALTVTAPAPIAGNVDIGTASFGPPAARTALSGRVVQAVDAANDDGPTTTDGCSPFSNAAAIAGNLAIVDRGTCTFVAKAQNAQAAGAIGIIVVDNQTSTCAPPGMGGEATDISIPAVSVSKRDGDAIKAQAVANVQVDATLWTDPTRLAGTSAQGYVRLYAPCTAELGSSTYHWDTVASPNLLMEPSINTDLLHGVDLTVFQLLDMGWTAAPRSGRTTLRR